ncbi:MAG: hypothetical protein OXC26_07745 [Albidovulum sp.]|nr:hypothetical protein [Albidovulum sp.]
MPDLTDENATSVLAMYWDQIRCLDEPQFCDGECEVRRLWDKAVAKALGRPPGWLSELRLMLHDKPHVSSLVSDIGTPGAQLLS